MNEGYFTDDEISALLRLVGTYPWEVVAQSFEVDMDATITGPVDGAFGIPFTTGRVGNAKGQPERHYITIENSLRDVPEWLDMPKLIVRAPDSLGDLKVPVKRYSTADPTVVEWEWEVYSALSLEQHSSVTSIEIWSTVLTSTGEDGGEVPIAASDTGLWIKLRNGRSLVFAVNASILCNVQLSAQPASQVELLSKMRLRRTLAAP